MFSVYRLVYNMLKRSLFSRVTNPDTHSAAEFVQTNRWHKQQLVTRSTDEVRTAWDAISLCRQNISAASQGAQIIDRLIDAHRKISKMIDFFWKQCEACLTAS